MSALTHRRRGAGSVIAGGVVYTGRLSDLGLLPGDPLNLTNSGELWLNDLDDSPALGQVTLGAKLYMDTNRIQRFTFAGMHVLNNGGFYGGTLGGARMPRGTQIIPNGIPPAGRVIGPDYFWNGSSYQLNNNPNDGGGLSRGIMVDNGGHLELYGHDSGGLECTILRGDFDTNSLVLLLEGRCYWKEGDEIGISMGAKLLRSMSQVDHTSLHVLASDSVVDTNTNTTVITLTSGLTYFRPGRLQYGTGAGLSFTNDGYTAANLLGHVPPAMDLTARTALALEINTAIANGRPNILDMRTKVFRVSRGTSIISPKDSYYTSLRFATHTMKMGHDGTYILDNMGFDGHGQGGALGRYGTHFHLGAVVANTSTNLGDYVDGSHVVNRCGFVRGQNRIHSFHGCNNGYFTNNTSYSNFGHAILFEDNSEKNNKCTDNMITFFRDPGDSYRLKDHDRKASGLWYGNVNNTILRNHFSDGHTGRWIQPALDRAGFPGGCFGLSSQQPIHPQYAQVQAWDSNTNSNCYGMGARIFGMMVDESGIAQFATRLESRVGEISSGAIIESPFTHETLYANNGGGELSDFSGNSSVGNYDNRAAIPLYRFWVVADCIGSDFSGATDLGTSSDHFMVAYSLYADPALFTTKIARNGFATYHGLLIFRDITAIGYATPATSIHSTPNENYGFVKADGVMSSWDLYTEYCEKLTVNNVRIAYIDSNPVWRSPGFTLVHHTSTYSAYVSSSYPFSDNSLAPAFLDYEGRVGGVARPNSYIMYDQPAFTAEVDDLVSPYVPGGAPSFMKVTNKVMYGLDMFAIAGMAAGTIEGDPVPGQGLNPCVDAGGFVWQRCSIATLADISGAKISYDRLSSATGTTLPSHHMAIARGMAIRITHLPYSAEPTTAALFGMVIQNILRTVATGWSADDFFYFGIPWPSSAPDPSNVWGGKSNVPSNWGYNPDGTLANYGAARSATKVTTKAAFLAATGRSFIWWRDTSTNILWARITKANDGYTQAGTGLGGFTNLGEQFPASNPDNVNLQRGNGNMTFQVVP